jgi:uncharacterized metal-binding protein
MAHDISLNIDSDGIAEMSCISGVIGKVQPIVELAQSGRPIIAIDGCAMGCTKSCLDACNLQIDQYFDISSYGFDKRDKWEDSLIENSIAMTKIYEKLSTSGYGFAIK